MTLHRAMACAAALVGLAACGPTEMRSVPGPATPYRVVEGATGAPLDVDSLAARLVSAEAVFVGEQHGDPATHRFQRDLLDALARRGVRVVVAMEMFERDVQPLLDRYLDGEVDENEFLAGARPWPGYASDYRTLVETARARGWPVVASNTPRPLAARVARAGLAVLDALPPDQRGLLAAEIDCPRDEYYARFVAQMNEHHAETTSTGPAGTDETVDRYYEAQCVKDETMAASVAAALAAGTTVVHFNGGFHSDYRLGIVPRVARRRAGVRLRVVATVPVADPTGEAVSTHRDRADYLVFTRSRREVNGVAPQERGLAVRPEPLEPPEEGRE